MEIANLIAQMKKLIKRIHGQKRFLNISQGVEERNVKHVRNVKRWKVNSFNTYPGASLVVQWLRLCAANAEGPSSIPGWGARSHTVQQRWEILCATTKTWLDLRIPKSKEFQKSSTFASLTMLKPLTVSQQAGKFLKRWEYQTTLPASWETCMQDKKKQSQTWNKELVQNWERSMSSLYIVTLFI